MVFPGRLVVLQKKVNCSIVGKESPSPVNILEGGVIRTMNLFASARPPNLEFYICALKSATLNAIISFL